MKRWLTDAPTAGGPCTVPGRWARPIAASMLLGMTLLTACDVPHGGLGERIYRDGRGEQGSLTYRLGPGWLTNGTFGCMTCHGEDGEGRFVQAGSVAGSAPPVTRTALQTRGYDAAALRRAIVDGVGVDGRTFSYYMPRWELDEHELQALLAYLDRL